MNYQKNFNSLALQKAEKELQMYYAIINGQLIETREEEIKYPLSEADNNIGGGRSNDFNSKTENTAIKLATDGELILYKKIVDKSLSALQYLNPDELEVIEAYYSVDTHSRHLRRTTSEVQTMTNKDKDFCENVRQKALSVLKNGAGS